ncbi:Holliday junction branch migration DNA helicase RuvB [Rickettsiales bacterium LUAb2]
MSKVSERIISAENTEFDNNRIRPVSLNDFIGQKQLKDNLEVFIAAAKKREQHLDHVLLYGPPGLGKTTLAEIIANEIGSNLKIASGPTITKAGDLAAILTNLEAKDVLFIDEIHRMNISVEEVLYSAMEDFKLDIMIGEGPSARSIRIDLPNFTLVGATTRYGLISNPLRDRFSIVFRLAFYDDLELQKIITRSAKILKANITEDGAKEIAKRSRGTPRIANSLLKRMCDFLIVSDREVIDETLANFALQKLGVDINGFDELDRKYLEAIALLYKGGPVGIDTLAAVLSENKGTIEDVVEPYLLKKGFVIKTPKGRAITEATWKYLGMLPKQIGDNNELTFE